MRNFFGDLEAVLQGNPKALKHFRRAWRELTDFYYHGSEPTGELAEFVKRGGALTTEFATEIENWHNLDEFQHLLEKKKTSLIRMPGKFVNGYVKIASTFTSWREALLRYSSFLAYLEDIKANGGDPNFYGMSKKKEVDVIDDDYDKAMKLANENLGAYDEISQNIEWLRDNNWLSFASWLEVNFTRTIQMYRNIWSGNHYLEHYINKNCEKLINKMGGGGNGNEPPTNNNSTSGTADDDGANNIRKLLRNAARKSPTIAMRALITLAMSLPMMAICSIANMLNPNDKELSPDVRRWPHLTLWKNQRTGEIYYIGKIGSMSDFFETVPLDGIIRDVIDIWNGKQTVGGMISNALASPANKLLNNTNPYGKAAVEMIFWHKLYPDLRKPSKINDNLDYLAQTVGLDWYYKKLTGKPAAPFSHGFIANSVNPDEGAYYYMLGKRNEFMEKELGKTTDGYTRTKRSELFRYARQAASYEDYPKMRKYLREYLRTGDDLDTTIDSLKQSARTLSPLYGLSEKEQMQFFKWLSDEDKKMLRRSLRYSERIKGLVAPR